MKVTIIHCSLVAKDVETSDNALAKFSFSVVVEDTKFVSSGSVNRRLCLYTASKRDEIFSIEQVKCHFDDQSLKSKYKKILKS